jgi:hypothetical protein
MRKFVIVGLTLIVIAAIAIAARDYVFYGLNEVATGQMGMAEIVLPSGKLVWLRRQSYAHTPEHLYISASDSYCAPYSIWHDYKLPPSVTGDTSSPLVFSFEGNTIVVHAPDEPKSPWLFAPKSFKVAFQKLVSSEYAAYATLPAGSNRLPTGWHRVEVPYGHNTCSL